MSCKFFTNGDQEFCICEFEGGFVLSQREISLMHW